MKRLQAIAAAIAAAIVAAGCASYQWGSTAHPYLKSMSVAPVANQTEDGQASQMLRMKLNQSLYQTSGIRPEDLEDGRVVLKATISRIDQRVVGSLANRTDDRAAKYGNVSTTTLYGVQVTVDYEVFRRGSKVPLIPKTTVVGEGVVPRLPDMGTARQIGLEAAMAEAARKIADDVSESW